MKNWLRQHKILTSIAVLLLLTAVSTSFLLLKTPIQVHMFPSIPTPTSIQPLIFSKSPTSIIATAPDQTTNASLFATISATFSRAFSDAEQKSVTITLSPKTTGTLIWSSNNTTVTFSQSSSLQTNQQYTITLTYLNKTLLWSFTTVSEDNLTQEQKDLLQQQADDNFGKWQYSLYQNYPWYDSLPIESNAYFVYFDTNEKKFLATLYVNPSDSQQIDSMKKYILSQFQSLGVPTTQFPIVWSYNPNPGSE